MRGGGTVWEWLATGGFILLVFGIEIFGAAILTALQYLLPAAMVLAVIYFVVRAARAWSEDDALWRRGQGAAARGGSAIVRNYTVDTDPPANIEIDPAWPGRTRIRIPAATALPMLGPARFVPPAGQGLRARYNRLRWEGPGRDDARRWEHLFEPDFLAIRRAAGRGGFSVTLNSAGMLIHLPFVVPRAEGLGLLEQHAADLHRTMAGIAEREEAALGLSFVEVEAQHQAECSCCWTVVAADQAVVCPTCGGLQHADCAQWAGGCGRFACAGTGEPLERDTAA